MNPHCKGCVYHMAPHSKGKEPPQKRYNDWCIQYSGEASKKVGHCKLHGGKKTHD